MRCARRLLVPAILCFLLPPIVAADDQIQIGPITGFTTVWHPAPETIAVPLGAQSSLSFRTQVGPDVEIAWVGATELTRDGGWSIAECPMDHAGQYVVGVDRVIAGEPADQRRIVLEVVAADPQISFTVHASVDPVDIGPHDVNAWTYWYYRGDSIAGLRTLSDPPEAVYLTSTERWVNLKALVQPRIFRGLIEWRTDHQAPHLGNTFRMQRATPGSVQVSVGLPDDPQVITLETYGVEITSHVSNQDVIPSGVPVTFTAVTNPPGFEEDVTWLASTKYGGSEPVMGQGPEFTVQFEDTWGPHPRTGETFQWLGVKADNTVFNQDQKTGACCLQSGSCIESTETECQAGSGSYGGNGTTCETAVCTGACCELNGDCTDGKTQEVCQLGGGTFQGGGTSCEQVTCPQPLEDCTITFLKSTDTTGTDEADHLNIGHWGMDVGVNRLDGYDAATDIVLNTGAAHFVPRDPDHFFVAVDYPQTPGELLQLATLEPGGAIYDPDTPFTRFTNFGGNLFRSGRQLLTSSNLIKPDAANPGMFIEDPASDDLFSAFTGALPGVVKDERFEDPTHKAKIGGQVRATFTIAGEGQCRALVPVCILNDGDGTLGHYEIETLTVRVRVYNEPFMDVGRDQPGTPGAGDMMFNFDDEDGDGVHDAGEVSEPYLDLSSGGNMYIRGEDPAATDGCGPVVNESHVQQQIERSSIAWAQACIKVEQAGGTIIEAAPADVLADGKFDINPASDDVVSINGIVGALPGVGEVVFTGPMPGANGYARVPANRGAALPPPLGLNSYMFIGPNLDIRLRTLAHEIGHALTNQGDVGNRPYVFFPAMTTALDDSVNRYRRILRSTEVFARECREDGDLGNAGNRLLGDCQGLIGDQQGHFVVESTSVTEEGFEPITPNSSVEEIIGYLLTIELDTALVPGEVMVLFEAIRDEPLRFAGEIATLLELPGDAVERIPQGSLRRLRKALGLLTLLGEQKGAALLGDFYRDTSMLYEWAKVRYEEEGGSGASKAEDILRHQIMGDYVALRRDVVNLLTKLESARLIEDCLRTIEREDYSLQLVMLRYLVATGRGNHQVIERLQELAADSDSHLRSHPALLDAITRLTPETR